MAKTRKCKTLNDARIVGGHIFFEDVRQCSLLDELASEMLDDKYLTSIRLVSLSSDWQQRVWLDYNLNRVEQINMEMTLRKEQRGQKAHWYAYRRVLGKLHKRYVGYSEQITESRLLEIAQKMPSA